MRYMGSKARFSSAILSIVLAARIPGQTYVEPFVGGANIFDKVPGPKLGADSNSFLISLWSAVSQGWKPPEVISQDEYSKARRESVLPATARTMPDHLIGFIGAGCSFGGKWFGGFARGGINANGQPRVYSRESSRAVVKQARGLSGASFVAVDYRELQLPPKALVYCDPPYAGTTGYAGTFDSTAFWEWANGLIEQGHTVFVSEYTAPVGWECVWSANTLSSVTRESRSKKTATERLFTK